MHLLSGLYETKMTKICLSPLPGPWGGYGYLRVRVLGGALNVLSDQMAAERGDRASTLGLRKSAYEAIGKPIETSLGPNGILQGPWGIRTELKSTFGGCATNMLRVSQALALLLASPPKHLLSFWTYWMSYWYSWGCCWSCGASIWVGNNHNV